MAKLSDLVQAAAIAAGVSDNAVRETARRVREAGYMQTGSAGRYGGAEMTEWDASNLLLGLTCADPVKDAGAAVHRYRALFLGPAEVLTREDRAVDPADSSRGRVSVENLCPAPMRWLGETTQGLVLGDALDRLIGMARTGDLQTLFRDLAVKRGVPDQDESIDKAINGLGMVFLKLDFRRPRPGGSAVFGASGARSYLSVDFGHQSAMETPDELDRLQVGDLVTTKTITHRVIFALGEALRR